MTVQTHRRRKSLRPRDALFHATAVVVACLFLAPLVWLVLGSLRGPIESLQPPLPPWPQNGASLQNYLVLDSSVGSLWKYTANSLKVAIGTAALSVLVALFAGYGFSRFAFPLKRLAFVLILTTIMIPFQSILTPLFLLLAKLGLQNSHLGLILVYTTLQLPFSVFMMRNAFDAVPKEIEEAARIDGLSGVPMLFRVMLPLVMPGVVTVGLFAFLNSWNEFLAALVLMTDQDKFTLPILMTSVGSGLFGAVNWGAVQAGVVVMMIPCLLLFLALQRSYIRGLTAGAVK